MAKLSNINNLFSVDSTGAIEFSTQVGATGYVLESRGAGNAPVWTDRDTGNVTGSGTLNKVVRWTATGSTVGDGPITFATNDSTFAGTVTAPKFVGSGTAAVFELIQSTTGAATYYVMDNTVETGGKKYRFGYTGGSSDKGSFTIYNETDSLLPLLISGANSTFAGTISAVGASTFTLNDGIFIKAINGTNNVAATNVWGYGLYEGASKLGEISLVRDGTASQMYIGTTGANQVLRIGSANKVTALTIDASQNATFAGSVTAAGDVVAYSDKKLKKNIKTLDGSKVYDMRGVGFTRKDNGNESSGVIAQEIQKIAPELISETDGTLGVAYGNLTGYLIEAVKELKTEIEELKKQINNG